MNVDKLIYKLFFALVLIMQLNGCSDQLLNNPYSEQVQNKNILYTSFSKRPKHLDPAISYSTNEIQINGQIYEPPLQYHYLKRPYELIPLAAVVLLPFQ